MFLHLALYISIFIFAAAFRWLLRSRRSSRLPPGPSRLPFFGNAFDMQKSPIEMSKWVIGFGDVVYAEAFGRGFVFLNTLAVANNLMDKRSAIYSDRPRMVMAGELFGANRCFPLKPYNEEFKSQRKIAQQEFTYNAAQKYRPIQEREIRRLVAIIVAEPNDLDGHIRRTIGTILMRVTYGLNCTGEDDKYRLAKEEVMEHFNAVFAPGAWLVDIIPALKYIPTWFPGSGFKRLALQWFHESATIDRELYTKAKSETEAGTVQLPNFVSNSLLDGSDQEALVHTASTLFGAGLETNASTLLSFILAMTLYPDVQKRAQAEIDSVIGCERLPTIADRHFLPYLEAVMAEVFRWAVPAPLGLPHALRQDDYYEGMFIPAGSTIIANVGSMMRDERSYPNATEFIPERFVGKPAEGRNAMEANFGFGRRRCPAMYYGEATFFIGIATLLATVDIAEARIENANVEFSSDMFSFPKPFKFAATYRSAQARALLLDAIEADS